jgi:hypothetical protein
LHFTFYGDCWRFGNKVKRGSFAAAPLLIDLSERQSHWLNRRDLRSEPLFPWFRLRPYAATFRPVDT